MTTLFLKRLRLAMSTVILLIGFQNAAYAGEEICSENGGSLDCRKGDIWFRINDGDSTRYASGLAACLAKKTGVDLRNFSYWANHPTAGFYTCEYDFYSSAGEFLLRQASGNWVTPYQACPSVPNLALVATWNDLEEKAEDPRGRLWCAYKNIIEEQCCSVGNPTLPGSGVKQHRETDHLGFGPQALTVQRHYRSRWIDGLNNGLHSSADFGPGWKLSYHAQISKVRPETRRKDRIYALRPDGSIQVFYGSGNPRTWKSNSNRDSLTELSTGWRIKNFADDSVENYNTAGKLISTVARNGATTKLAYDAAGRLSSVTNSFGRKLTFTYDSNGRPLTLVAPGGEITTYSYDTKGNLTTVTWPGGAQRRYHYEDARYPGALTGVTDEMGVRIGTYDYDNMGRIAATQRANGTDRITFTYAADGQGRPSSQVTTPNSYLNYTFQDSGGVRRPIAASTTASGDPNVGNIAASTAYASSQNEPTKQVALDGTVTFTAYDNKGRASERATFPASFQTATTRPALANATRVVSTQWHATWNLPLQQAEPNRITAYTYDSKGNLTGQSSTATTDNKGSAKFTATKTGPTTATGWGYDAKSLNTSIVETVGGVVVAQVSLSFDSAGNAIQLKNLLTGETATGQYNAHGRLIQETDPFGVRNVSFTPRGFILSDAFTSSSAVPSYTLSALHNAAGLVTDLNTGTGMVYRWTYDANHRVTSITLNGSSLVASNTKAHDHLMRLLALLTLSGDAKAQAAPPMPAPGGGLRGPGWLGVGILIYEIGRNIYQSQNSTTQGEQSKDEKCDPCKDPSKQPKWTSRGSKHTVPPQLPWASVRAGTANGKAAKYKPELTRTYATHEALEQSAWATGKVVKNTNSSVQKVMRLNVVVGASEGADTTCILVLCSAGEIHGYPAPESDCNKAAVPYP
ncbi:MAG: hypothetical protein RIS44_1864 [Pseudomonadota bacterium]